MTESATLRDRRRQDTAHRISRCAQRLTEQHGLDGFTMDQLAAEAGVSRRTLFNYFPGKIDAVLGEVPQLPPADLATFHAGGPHGRLVDDLAELAAVLLRDTSADRESLESLRRILPASPRLLAAAHQRFEELTAEFASLIIAREGEGFGLARARLLVRLMVVTFDVALDALLDDPEPRPLSELYRDTLATARDLLS